MVSMNEIVKVVVENGEQLVSARELHEFLEVKTRYNDWVRNRIEKYGFVENEDFTTITKNLVNGGTETNHILKIDMAKELSMVENNDKGRIARKYFIECEKRLKSMNPITMLMSLSKEELAMTTLQLTEQIKEKDNKIEQQQAKIVEVKDTVNKITEGVDVALLAKTVTDYVNKLAKRTEKNHGEVYNDIYGLLGRRLSMDLNVRHKNFCKSEENKAIENLKHNMENGLRGEHRIRPFRKSDTRYKISKLEYIVDILGKGMELFEVIAKLAEVKVDEVIGKYKLYEEEAK